MGAVSIEKTDKRVNWNVIQAEFISGASYGALSKKFHLSKSTIYQHAKAENWQEIRTNVANEARTKTIQKTADKISDNATIAEDLKKRLLLRLKRIEEKYPMDATEVRTRQGNNTAIFRIRDLTAAYKDLTENIPTGAGNDIEDLTPLGELLK